MKKSSLGMLSVALMFLMVGCANSFDTNVMPVSQEVSKKEPLKIQQLDDACDMAQYIGMLHNESMYAFVDYLRAHDMTPYSDSRFTREMVIDFMTNFMPEHLESSPFYDEVMNLDMIEIDLGQLLSSGEEILHIIENERNVDLIDNEISRYIENIDATVPKEQGAWIYSSVAYVALYTNQLWSNEWDYIERSMVPEQILYCVDGSEGDDSNEDESNESEDAGEEGEDEQPKNEEQKQKEIKQADIWGALHGAYEGAKVGAGIGAPSGPAVVLTTAWGGLIGAATGAAVYSAVEAILQEMDRVAYYIHEDDVDIIAHDSYMANYLKQQYAASPERFVERYGMKFNYLLED